MKIKICGLREPENVAAIAALKPDYLGFIFYRSSPRYVGEGFVLDRKRIGDCRPVGVFVNETPAAVAAIVQRCGLEAVQLHGDEPPEDCRTLRGRAPGITIIKAMRVRQELLTAELEPYYEVCDYLLFDTAAAGSYGGSGRSFNWRALHEYRGPLPFFLSGGIGAGEARTIKENFRHQLLSAVDLNSRIETAPGIKSTTLAAEAINILRSA